MTRRVVLHPVLHSSAHVRIEGRDRLRSIKGPVVIVANHTSDLDTALLFHALPRRITRKLATGAAADRFFSKARNAAVPSMLFNVFPIDRPGRARRSDHKGLSGRLLDQGMSLLIFPEGTRKHAGAVGRFSTGPARLAAQRGLPIIPVSIVGSGEAWKPDQRRPKKGRQWVVVNIGFPMKAAADESVRAFSERLRSSVVSGCQSAASAYQRALKRTS